VLDNWLPFLIYALFAAAIPATMIAMSFVLPARPVTRTRQRMLPFESGVSEGAPERERRFTVSFYLTAILFILCIRSQCVSTPSAGSGSSSSSSSS
jgi:NADH:ubiquinone oxidoreductase subunit 3 (subunit A)